MSGLWLPQAHKRDLSGRRGNGPFPGDGPRGIVLHVNASGRGSQGTSPDWYASGGGPDEVCPNWQVMRDGTIWQFLPANWQPWTQRDGNGWGPSIETGGDPSEPLSAAQIASCGLIVAFLHQHLGVPLAVTNSTSVRGLGTHAMGGDAWGGHPCPGAIRSRQRTAILDAARGHRPSPTPFDLLEWIMSLPGAPKGLTYQQHLANQAAADWAHPLAGKDANGRRLVQPASFWVTEPRRWAAYLAGLIKALKS